MAKTGKETIPLIQTALKGLSTVSTSNILSEQMRSSIETLEKHCHVRRECIQKDCDAVVKGYVDNGIINTSIRILNFKEPNITVDNSDSWPILPAYLNILKILIGLTDASSLVCEKVAESEIIKIAINEIKTRKQKAANACKKLDYVSYLLCLLFNIVQHSLLATQKLQELGFAELVIPFLKENLYVFLVFWNQFILILRYLAKI